MERFEDKDRLDEALTNAIGSESKKPDFEKWKEQHADPVRNKSLWRSSRNSTGLSNRAGRQKNYCKSA